MWVWVRVRVWVAVAISARSLTHLLQKIVSMVLADERYSPLSRSRLLRDF